MRPYAFAMTFRPACTVLQVIRLRVGEGQEFKNRVLTGDWSEWLRSHPDVSGLLSDYQPVETINGIGILKPR